MVAHTRRIGLVVLGALGAVLLAACGEEADTRSATTVGAATHELVGVGFEALDSPLLAVEFDDGTQVAAAADADVFDDVGMGSEALSEAEERMTWGGVYLIVLDDSPDRVVLEETSSGEWRAVSAQE